jgi:hypothetical protein
MFLKKRNKFYIDEKVFLVTVKGGNKRTGSGGVVTKSQNALTCATCFAIVGQNHLDAHTKTHTAIPVIIGDK